MQLLKYHFYVFIGAQFLSHSGCGHMTLLQHNVMYFHQVSDFSMSKSEVMDFTKLCIIFYPLEMCSQ